MNEDLHIISEVYKPEFSKRSQEIMHRVWFHLRKDQKQIKLRVCVCMCVYTHTRTGVHKSFCAYSKATKKNDYPQR